MCQSFLSTEPSLTLKLEGPLPEDSFLHADVGHTLTSCSAHALVKLMTTLPNGVERMSSAVPGVEEEDAVRLTAFYQRVDVHEQTHFMGKHLLTL